MGDIPRSPMPTDSTKGGCELDTIMIDCDHDTCQKILKEMYEMPFPYPVRARTKDRDGFVRAAHSCLAVPIEDYSDKDGNFKTGVGLLARVVEHCARKEGDYARTIRTIDEMCSLFKGAAIGSKGGPFNKRKFLYFEDTTYHSL